MNKHNFSNETILALASAGGALEMYDFVVYIFFAPTLAQLFFPAEHSYVALMATFAIFASGYLFRPMGGFLFGHLGDRYGRRTGLLITIYLMGLTMLLMALMPTYEHIGIMAPICFFILRLMQGVALGGDLPGAITFVAEYAERQSRGLQVGLLYFGVNVGLLMASFVGMLLTHFLTQQALNEWGWRLAFLMGTSLFVVGAYFRMKNIETPLFQQLSHNHHQLKVPLIALFQKQSMNLIRALFIIALQGIIIVQLFLYMPIYLQHVANIDEHSAFIYNTENILLFSACIPVFGYLSDRVGRKIILVISSLFFLLLTYPVYHMIDASSISMLLAGLFLFAIFSALLVSVAPVTITELFPTNVRNSGVAVSYNLGFGIFGGLSPLISTWLIRYMHNPAALGFNVMIIAFITLLCVIPMKHPKNQPL